MIVIHNLKGEPYIRAKRWRDTMDIDPERINADHWREQDYQAATPFMPFQPMQLEQPPHITKSRRNRRQWTGGRKRSRASRTTGPTLHCNENTGTHSSGTGRCRSQ